MLKGFLFFQQTAIRTQKEPSAKRIRFKHQRSTKVGDNDVFTSHNTTVQKSQNNNKCGPRKCMALIILWLITVQTFEWLSESFFPLTWPRLQCNLDRSVVKKILFWNWNWELWNCLFSWRMYRVRSNAALEFQSHLSLKWWTAVAWILTFVLFFIKLLLFVPAYISSFAPKNNNSRRLKITYNQSQCLFFLLKTTVRCCTYLQQNSKWLAHSHE